MRMLTTAILVVLLSCVGGRGLAHAGVLVSGLLNSGAGHQARCIVVNAHKKETPVVISLHTNAGSTLAGPVATVIPPGESRELGSATTGFSYCRVEASKKKVRAIHTIEGDVGGSDFRTIASTPVH